MDISQKAQNTHDKLTDHMKLKEKKDQSLDSSVLFERGNKIIAGGRGRERRTWDSKGGSRAGSGVGEVMGDVQRVRKLKGGIYQFGMGSL